MSSETERGLASFKVFAIEVELEAALLELVVIIDSPLLSVAAAVVVNPTGSFTAVTAPSVALATKLQVTLIPDDSPDKVLATESYAIATASSTPFA